jgi:hypothetical protein
VALIGLLFILGGGWLCIPGRNHGLETLQSSCRLDNAGMVHLYEGGGGDWYSVTVQSRFPWTEREVFWSSGSPVLTRIIYSCLNNVLVGYALLWEVRDAPTGEPG